MDEQKHLWEIKHPYYCKDTNYFATGPQHRELHLIEEYKSWADFLKEMGDADDDLNFLFRWDWEISEESISEDVNYRDGILSLFFMVQRKGFHLCSKVSVCKADEPNVLKYLKQKSEYLKSVWEPLL